MGFRQKNVDGVGSALFRGTLPPRAEEFEFLRRDGVELRPSDANGALWALRMRHPKWGDADLVSLKDVAPPPRSIVEYSGGMTAKERDEVLSGRSLVSVTTRVRTGDVLRDRKALLWYLRRVMGDDGVGAMDHGSQRFWPRAALDFELSHEAPLDVESLFVVHAVTDAESPAYLDQEKATEDGRPRRPTAYWMHTHGLDTLDAFDFDILDPGDGVSGDCFRSLAHAVLEGRLEPGSATFEIAQPNGMIRMVPADQFMRSASPTWRAKRDSDPDHSTRRSVVCEPAGKLGRLLGDKPSPSKFFMQDDMDRCVLHFSSEASDQMAERARMTLGMCRLLQQEFSEFEFPCLVKIGYETDSGGKEHLWFRVHEFGEGDVDATLINQPFDIAGMSEGQRKRYSLDELTDWQITTPFSSMSPRDTRMARGLREDPEQAAEMLKVVKMMREVGMM